MEPTRKKKKTTIPGRFLVERRNKMVNQVQKQKI